MLRNFRFFIPGRLAGMGHPGYRRELTETLDELRRQGVTALVSLDEEGVPDDIIAEQGFAYRHYPCDDFCAPTVEQADDFCRFVDEQNAQGKAVAVHCWAGRGRTGTMIAAYLIHQGESAARALHDVRRYGGIETPGQEAFLYEFEAIRRAKEELEKEP